MIFLGFVLVFYGPLTHFMYFLARSVNIATLFPGKPPWGFTSTQCPVFRLTDNGPGVGPAYIEVYRDVRKIQVGFFKHL